jgi:predicted extracellular nuclease
MSGSKSVGQRVNICSGFVTAIVYNGFFIQETPVASGISSGLFVFTSTGSKPASVGSGVTVSGTIAVYNGMKELTSVSFQVLSTYKTFTPVTIPMPVSDVSVLDSFQGMVVDIVAAASYNVAISEYYNLDRYGEAIVCAADVDIGRLYQYSTEHYPSVSGYSQHLDLLKRSCITTDDNSNVQNPLPVLFGGLYPVDTDRFFLRGGDVVTTLRGPLWINTAYSKYYFVATLKQDDLVVDTSSNPRPAPPKLSAGDMKVVSSNLLNYFTTLNVRGANTAEEFQRQAAKITVALTAMNADVFALTELENSAGNPAAKDLVSRLNSANPSRLYVATSILANLDTIGGDQIKVDIVFDQNMFELVGWATLTDAQVSPALLSNSTLGCIFCVTRVPIAASLRLKSTGANVTIVANHFKSKGNSANNAVGLDLDQQDGAALFNHMRTLCATALLNWLGTNP